MVDMSFEKQTERKTKEKILEAAIDVISEKGYYKASLREIAKRAGVSKPLILWYFRKKRFLVRAIAEKLLPGDVIDECLEKGYEGAVLLDCIINKYLEKYNDKKMKKLLIYTLSLSLDDEKIGREFQNLCREKLAKMAEKVYGTSSKDACMLTRMIFGALLCHILNPVEDVELYRNIIKKYCYTLYSQKLREQ